MKTIDLNLVQCHDNIFLKNGDGYVVRDIVKRTNENGTTEFRFSINRGGNSSVYFSTFYKDGTAKHPRVYSNISDVLRGGKSIFENILE